MIKIGIYTFCKSVLYVFIYIFPNFFETLVVFFFMTKNAHSFSLTPSTVVFASLWFQTAIKVFVHKFSTHITELLHCMCYLVAHGKRPEIMERFNELLNPQPPPPTPTLPPIHRSRLPTDHCRQRRTATIDNKLRTLLFCFPFPLPNMYPPSLKILL